MRNPQPSLSTRTVEFAPRDLPLQATPTPPPPSVPDRRPADRIKDALLRWLEEEL